MKLSRKLIPAMIMLLVSAVLMSTASFAWFSTNTSAKADGFSVQIAAAKNLLIKDAEDTDGPYKVSVNYEASDTGANKKNMDPASTNPAAEALGADGKPVFYSVSDATDIAPEKYEAGAKTKFAKTTEDYVTKSVKLNATGEYDNQKTSFGNVVAKITATDTNDENDASPVMPALRVLLVVKQGTSVATFLYAPVGDATEGYVVIEGETYDEDGTVAPDFSDDDTAIITGLTKETEYTVDIYIWFEGQDEACSAVNAINIDKYAVSITFELVAA